MSAIFEMKPNYPMWTKITETEFSEVIRVDIDSYHVRRIGSGMDQLPWDIADTITEARKKAKVLDRIVRFELKFDDEFNKLKMYPFDVGDHQKVQDKVEELFDVLKKLSVIPSLDPFLTKMHKEYKKIGVEF